MGLLFTSLIYSIVFFILTTKELITDKYDHDIDQFMYFGNRILHGELIWTNEFDDKSPIVQYIFSIPAAFKNTNIFVVITIIFSFIAAFYGYLMLKDMLQNSALEISKKTKNSILYFGIILYLTLLVCIYGSLHHINAISSSLCLITIALTYLNQKKKNKLLKNISAITSALAISIRPYYLLNIIALPLWIYVREGNFISKNKRDPKQITYLGYIKSQLNWILILTFYIILFNLSPYILTGNISDFIYGIKLNSIDYVNQNIFERQYINIGRNPILYPIILGMILLPLIRIFFRRVIYKFHLKKDNGLVNLHKLDIDIIFFGIVSPILLEIMFYRKHFFGHYYTLFSPYILISIVLLLSISTQLNKIIHNYPIFKNTINILSIMSLIICLITNQSIPNSINEILNKDISIKSHKAQLIKEFVDQERNKDGTIGFLAPENNYLHWQLDESRHGFPQKAVFINIAKGKMDNLINQYENLNYKFLLPTKNQLCASLNRHAPQYIITGKNDYSFNCLMQSSSKYNLLSGKEEFTKNNIFVFERINK